MKNNKDKEIRLRVDEDFIDKVDYLQRINDYKNRSDTVRKVVEKEYAKNVECDIRFFEFLVNKMNPNELEKYITMYETNGIAVEGKEKEDGQRNDG